MLQRNVPGWSVCLSVTEFSTYVPILDGVQLRNRTFKIRLCNGTINDPLSIYQNDLISVVYWSVPCTSWPDGVRQGAVKAKISR
jgi:hypothetical protein